MIVYEFLLYLYLANVITIIIHELGHSLFALIYKFKKIKIQIGEELLSINLKFIKISPIVFSGSVSVSKENLESKKPYQIILFFLGGILTTLISLVISIIFLEQHLIFKCLMITSLISIVTSLLPFNFLKTDIGEIINYCNKQRLMKLQNE